MAFASLFAPLDDITPVLDDVALMTKTITKGVAGVIGDDPALNVNQITDTSVDKELPTIWVATKSSLASRAIFVPLALLLSFFLPAAITPLLMVGGAYLYFEGVEKLLCKSPRSGGYEETGSPTGTSGEEAEIKGVIHTDFILSAETTIIMLSMMERCDAVTQSLMMTTIGVSMTIFVYGLVDIIVELDDLGMLLMREDDGVAKTLGRGSIAFMPWFIRTLSVVSTLAMLLVGGDLVVHNFAPLHHFPEVHHWADGLAGNIAGLVTDLVSGAIVYAVVLLLLYLANKGKSH